jgi:hypothetical protein
MRPSLRTSPFLLVLLLLPAFAVAACASTARDEVLQLVPDDMGLCLVVSDLRGQVEKLADAPWIKRFLGSSLGKMLIASPELAKLKKVDSQMRQGLGVGLAELRDEIFGDAVVLAYRPGAPDKPGQEQGLLVLRARKAELLARLVKRLNQEGQRTGEIKALQERQYRGVRYVQRKKAREDQYYFLSGSLLIGANREELLRAVIDRWLSAGPAKQSSRLVRGLRGTETALVALWLNPRAFDAELHQQQVQANRLDAPIGHILAVFQDYWRALDGITLAMKIVPEPELGLTLEGRAETLPAAFRQLVAVGSQPSELWDRFPQEAAVTAAGRVDFTALDQVVAEFLTAKVRERRRQRLQHSLGPMLDGLDLFTDVLPRLGPDYGFCLAAAPDPAAFPHVLVALRIQPGPEGAPVDEAVLRALRFFAGMAVAEHNRTHKATPIRLKELPQGTIRGVCLVGKGSFPTGMQPAFALKEGYLVLASCPAALERFGQPVPKEDAVPRTGGEMPLLRIHLPRLARLLQAHREAFVTFLAEKNHVPRSAVERGLDGLLDLLGLADRLEVTSCTGEGRITWKLRLPTKSSGP